MPLPTIFFCTNTGTSSPHAVAIQRVHAEIATPNFISQFRIIPCITDDPAQILQELEACKKEVIFFYFGGRDEHFQGLLRTTFGTGASSLFKYLAALPQLDLVFLSYCSRNIFVDPLLGFGIETVVGTSRHLPLEQANTFSTVFCQHFLLYKQTTEDAYNQAIQQACIQVGHPKRQFAGLHGNPHLRLRRWWRIEPPPRIVGAIETPASHIMGQAPDDTAQAPELPETIQLPIHPFPGIQPYGAKDARVFWGRHAEFTDLYNYLTTATTQAILVLHGRSGVGKTSLLRASLLPQLQPHYFRRYYNGRETTYLFKTLCQQVRPLNQTMFTKQDWTPWLAAPNRDLLLIVDQFETQLISKKPTIQADLVQLMEAIRVLVADPVDGKKPRVIFCVREENLAQCQALLANHHLLGFAHNFSLKRLNAEGIRTILNNFAPSSTLAEHYQFSIEDSLVDRIAVDLTEDRGSVITPYLQAILTKLRKEASITNRKTYNITLQHYDRLYQEGTLLRDFVDDRLTEVRRQWPPIINYKKLIDLLITYTSLAQEARGKTVTSKGSTQQMAARLQEFYVLTEKAGVQGRNFQLGHKLLEKPISQQYYRLTSDYTWFEKQQSNLSFTAMQIKAAIVQKYTKAKQGFSRCQTCLWGWLNQRVEVTWGLFCLFTLLMLAFLLFLHRPIQSAAQQLALSTGVNNQLTLIPQSSFNMTSVPLAALTTPIRNFEAFQQGSGIELKRVALLYASDALPAAHMKRHSSVLAFSSDSALLFAGGGDNTLEIWSVAGADAHPSLVVPTQAVPVTTIHIQGNLLLYTTADGGVGHLRLDALGRIDPVQRDEPIELLRHQGAVTAVQVSGDGNLLVTGGEDGTLYQYDLPTRQVHAFIHDPANPITAVALHPRKEIIAYAGANQLISILARATGAVSHQLTGHTGRVNSLEFSLDGAHLLSAGSDGSVCIWQVDNAVRDYCFVDLSAPANLARYSPDGILIIAARDDGFLWIWDAASYRLLATVAAHPGGISALAVRADGRQLATTGWNSDIALWDINLPLRSLQ